MRNYVCFLGEPIRDYYIETDHWPRLGDKSSFRSIHPRLGGTVANAAAACRLLGAPTEIVGRLPRSEAAESMRTELAAQGIGVDALAADGPGPEPVCFVFVVDGSNVVLYPDRSEESVLLSEVALSKLAGAAVVVTTSERLRRVGHREAVHAAFMECRQGGGQIIVDLDNGEAVDLSDELVRAASCYVMNEFGFERLSTEERLDRLVGRVSAVDLVVTHGADGVTILGETHAHIPGRAVEAVDPTGAGDAFVGALSYGLLHGWDLRATVEAANEVAAHAVTQIGPRLQALPDEFRANLHRAAPGR